MAITDKNLKRARTLIVNGMSLAEAAIVIGAIEGALTAGLEALKARTRRYANFHYQGQKWRGNVIPTNVVPVPAHVIAERDHRATLVPRDATALLQGDPLPGYSMQEKVGPPIAPRINHDPLDALVFGRTREDSV